LLRFARLRLVRCRGARDRLRRLDDEQNCPTKNRANKDVRAARSAVTRRRCGRANQPAAAGSIAYINVIMPVSDDIVVGRLILSIAAMLCIVSLLPARIT